MSGDRSKANGTDPKQNGDDIEMNDDSSKSQKPTKGNKDKDGDEEMTVVVPPPKKTPAHPGKDGETSKDAEEPEEPEIDPKEKAINGTSTTSPAIDHTC